MIRLDAHTTDEVLHLFPQRAQAAGRAGCEECGHAVTSPAGQWTDNPDFYYAHQNRVRRCWQMEKRTPDSDWPSPIIQPAPQATVKLKPRRLRAV